MNFPDRMTRTGSPVSGIASLFRQAQKPFGLCFATPVRTASHEDVDKLSDDKLTYDELVCRHPLAGSTDKNVPQVSPEAQDTSYNEEVQGCYAEVGGSINLSLSEELYFTFNMSGNKRNKGGANNPPSKKSKTQAGLAQSFKKAGVHNYNTMHLIVNMTAPVYY